MAGGERDKDAFIAFGRAAKSNYPVAFKFVGDAFLEGRGLPSGESPSPQTAIAWYKKAVDVGLAGAQKAIDEVQAQIDKQTLIKQKQDAEAALRAQKEHETAEREKFDPSIFQNQQFMTYIYTGQFPSNVSANKVILYISGFVDEVHDKIIFLSDGQKCGPLISGNASGKLKLGAANAFASLDSVNGDTGNVVNIVNSLTDSGKQDALALFNRYSCDNDVTKTVMRHINLILDPIDTPPRPDSRDKNTERDVQGCSTLSTESQMQQFAIS